MNKRGSYGTMAERIARTQGAPDEPLVERPPGDQPDPAATMRHVWVTDRHGRLPGLLLEWVRRPDGWHGRVLHAVLEGGVWVIVEELLPAGLLDPVDASTPSR